MKNLIFGIAMGVITLSITGLFGVVGYVYTSNQSKTEVFMTQVTSSLNEVVVNAKLANAWAINTDARLVKQEAKLDQLYAESKNYWKRGKRYVTK